MASMSQYRQNSNGDSKENGVPWSGLKPYVSTHGALLRSERTLGRRVGGTKTEIFMSSHLLVSKSRRRNQV